MLWTVIGLIGALGFGVIIGLIAGRVRDEVAAERTGTPGSITISGMTITGTRGGGLDVKPAEPEDPRP